MSTNTAYQSLQSIFKRLNYFDHATTILGWDQMVMMPAGGVASRSETLAELSVMHHELLASDRVVELITHCESDTESLTDAEVRSVQAMREAYQDVNCLPTDLVKAQVLAGSACEHGWRSQRKANDWAGFQKNFNEVVWLAREEARVRQESADTATPYDALLDLHCRGDSSELIDRVFSELKAELPTMIDAAIERQAMAQTAAHATEATTALYPISEQTALSHALLRTLGFNFDEGRLDISAHPFSTGVRGDQRITTRYDESTYLDALLATAHETGHASYEAGLPEQWSGLPVGNASNMCIHESQSLLFEKMVTLSAPFLQHLHELIKTHLSAGTDLSFESLIQQARRVSKSYIRVEADELTYPIHVALRFDIERDLINGAIEPSHIPEAWDAAMQAGLGLSTKDNHTNGCLQDIHWTDGTFGYFPSYTMGAVNSAQLFQAVIEAHPDWQTKFAEGDIGFVRTWLSDNIWCHGCHRSSQELIQLATGSETQSKSLLTHLKSRYLDES